MPIVAIILSLSLIALGVYLINNKSNQENFATAKTEEILTTKPEEIEPVNNETITTTQEADSTTETNITENEKVEENQITNNTDSSKNTVYEIVPVSVEKSYTSEAVYFASNNKYTIDVTLDVKDGVVINSDVMYGNKETGYQHPLQERFDGAYKTQVVGKRLEDISLSRVGGASLTSKAFNEAIANIIDQTTQS